MQPITILIIFVCLWALTNLWLLPLSKDRWKAADLRQKITRAGTLVILEKVRDLAVIGTVTVVLVILLVWIAGALSIVSFAAPKTLIEAIASVYDVAKAWAEGYASALGILGLLGAAVTLFLSARQAKQRIAASWVAKANEVRARLQQNPSEIGAAQQDPELQPMVQRLGQLVSLLAQHDQDEAESSQTTTDVEAIREEISSVLSMLAIEIARKELILDPAITTPSDERHDPATWRQRWMRALASERLSKDFGLIKKPLSYVVTGLLFISLIGWTAEPLASSLQIAVNNLRVNVLEQDARRELDATLSQAPSPAQQEQTPDIEKPSAATIQTTSRLLARAAVRGMVRSDILDRLANSERAALSEAEFVRASILEQHIDLPEHADAASRVRKEVAQGIVQNPHDTAGMGRLTEHVERELHPHVERLQKEKPGLFMQLAAKLEARYAGPLSPLDAQGKLLAHVFDEALGAIDVHPSNELGKQAQKLMKEFGKEALKTWVNAYAKTYTTNLILETTRPEVVARMSSRFTFEVSGEASRFAKDLQAAEGRGWVKSTAEQQDAHLSQAVARQVAAHYGNDERVRAVVTERLGGYDELFPPMAERDGMGSGSVPGGGVGGNGSRQAATHSQGHGKTYTQSRATNFHLASRSFRVRGVLIGQDLPSKGLDVEDIRWTLRPGNAGEPTRVVMEIRLDGEWVVFGSFEAAVVNQALRYAADRRVIATTITSGDGEIIRRVTYVHPVLADTPLGCRIVEADRFVDKFSSDSYKPVDPRLAQLASDRQQVGRWMKTVEFAEQVAAIPSYKACPRDQVERVIKDRKLGEVKLSPAVADSFERFLATEEKKNRGSTIFLRRAHACATSQAEALAKCLCDTVKIEGLPNKYWFPEDHTSQFRERQAVLAPNLQWMKRSRDHLAHIDLWVHTTFAVRKNTSGGGAGGADESTASAVDFPPEQLASLKDVITEKLPGYLAGSLKSSSYDEFMMPLEDFVLLQRFMRAAFAGGLGRDFPLTKLVQLERDTREFVPYQPTIRWEPAGNSDSMLMTTLKEAGPKAANSYITWKKDSIDRRTSEKPFCDSASK